MIRARNGTRFAVVAAAFALVVAACGGDDEGEAEDAAPPETAAESEEPDASVEADAESGVDAEPDESADLGDGDAAVPGVSDSELRFGLVGEWTLDPASTIGSAQSMQVGLAVYDHLARPAADGSLEPELLTSWESDDLVSWTLTLREGVVFHDGNDFDADALVAHFDRLRDPDVACPCAPQLASIASMSAVDSLTVEVELSEPWAAFPVVVLGAPSSLMASPAAIEAAGSDYGTVAAVGTGPYRLVESVPGERVVVERNPDYWGSPADFARVTFLPIPDEQTRLQSLRAGDIDVMTSINPAIASQAADAGLAADTIVGLGPLMVQINHAVEPLDRVEVRQALAFGVDRDALNQVAYGGGSSPAIGLLPPDSPFAVGVNEPNTDVERARAIMDEVGPVTLRLSHTPDPGAQRVAQVLQQMWGDVGFDIQLQPVEQAQYIPSVFGRDYELALWTGPEIRDPDEMTAHVSTGGGINVSGYSNPRVDELLEAGRIETDPAARVEIYREMYGVLAEDVPTIYTLRKVGAIVWSDAVASVPAPETWGVQIIDVRSIRSAS